MIDNNLDPEKNKTLNLQESLKGLEVIKSKPVRISLNMTGKCNIRCIYCHLTYADYFSKDEKGITYIEQMIKFGNRIQDSLNSSQVDMFGDSVEISIKVPSTCKGAEGMQKIFKAFLLLYQ